ncbi:cysteine dioxygenase Cdg1p [[Candida] anglica]|uniref:Cysteine dioxygenase n=1 Tax=[Candida] anglica TaxID=148631 RepID=A0ABP0EHM6_9ASCO
MLTVNHFDSPHLRPQSGCGSASPRIASAPASARVDPIFDNKFGELIQKLKDILGPNKGISSEDVDIEKVKQVMEEYESDESEWGQFALHDDSRNYSRNGIVDINGNANLLILVWSPGKSSAIHDHANAHCCMKILKGELCESLYNVPDHEGDELQPKRVTPLKENVVGYISDDIGLHKISNNLTDRVSVSLHLYTPPYASMFGCSMYEAKNGKKHHVEMSKYYSWQGEIVDGLASSSC